MEILKKIIKRILVLSFITSIIPMFQGCSFIQVKNPNLSDIVENIEKVSDLSVMQKENKSKLRKFYSINSRDLEDFVLYAPKTNMEANEILILKVKNQDDIDKLQELIEKRIENQSESFKNYEPEQYDLLENRTLKVKGKYIILVVSKDVDKIIKAINDSFE